ncbi:MAG: hypothetical protein A3A32_02415 [Candidatus Wildermuthbacteria bacterium RIFCSPLOWO2_01_FULL_48_35]|uniref:FAD/NAD(P)-binding domain-containing protein n=2 Tax=Candidatus Wildermuthiibacteriota TaxID=1817923 RepID=A0A1G2RQL9_9BACT|nr:MAG: hypothetical protein A3D59_03305 [Candidatus Wildermuthbacteria bacterium RIFCSPHIGHO2_02_FULL_47_17]OHA75117.1 MAG: hypothetical protein A3A32_02415 [Candidatus Wildermuthbacteria bacterium RIFCSPLOWO2_01_FULL_48_35]
MVSTTIHSQKQIIIVGGGFGGIRCALELAKNNISCAKITLISDKPYFEYKPALYRVVTGRSEQEACVSIAEIFKNKPVEFMQDRIVSIDGSAKQITGQSGKIYPFDFLALALGAETDYFSISGLKEFSYCFKAIPDALRLRRHIHEMFRRCTERQDDAEEDVCRLHFVVVGAGSSGVEAAGELVYYAKRLAKTHGIDSSFVTVDLIEASPRILPMVPEKFSSRVANRLRSLGVNIFTNRPMGKEEAEQITVRGMTMKTDTVIWTAGVKPNHLYSQAKNLLYGDDGKIRVDEYLRPQGLDDFFIIGDGAATPHSGFAQTANADGKFVAENIRRALKGESLKKYYPKKPASIIPVGPGWAAASVGPFIFYGIFSWILRRAADFRYFVSVIGWRKTLKVFFAKRDLCDACGICEPR